MAEPFIATRIYMKPLLPSNFEVDAEKVLKRTKRNLFKRIKAELQQETFSDAAKKAFAKAMKIEVKPSSLRVTATHPAFAPMVKGQKSEQMGWLTKADRPIPIITETGKLIFRSATARSMKDGKWIHPGRKPSTFIDTAKKETREHIKKVLRKEAAKELRMALQRAAR